MKPIFPDCAFPEDCQCASRGYQFETDHCLVPKVAEAAAMFGIPTQRLFKKERVPRAVSTDLGSLQPLPNSGNMAIDVLAALKQMGVTPPFDPEQLDRVIRRQTIGGSAVILHTRHEKLKSGVSLLAWLTLSRSEVGDAAYWNIKVHGADHAVSCAHDDVVWRTLELLRRAGGGVVKADEYWCDVPTEDDIRAAESAWD